MEQGRAQLQMMLLQQTGAGSLPLTNLPPERFLSLLRTFEQFLLDEKSNPVIVYWSSQQAKRLLPKGPRYRELMRECFCISVFSEDKRQPPDEWCFLVLSQQLSLIIYGQQSEGIATHPVFQCNGSVDPLIVREAFDMLLPSWQMLDLNETNRLEDAVKNIGVAGTIPEAAHSCRKVWPVVKTMSVQQPFLLPIQAAVSHLAAIDQAALSTSNLPANLFTAPPPVPALEEPRSLESDTLGQAGAALCPPAPFTSTASAVPATVAEAVVIPPAAQIIIRDIIGLLRHSDDVSSILQLAIEKLTIMCKAHRGLIWQVVDSELAVTQEHSVTGLNCFGGERLGSPDSTAILLEFLSCFPDESYSGVISVPDTFKDTKLHKMSPQMASLIELGDVRARLVAQLKCRGKFSGFLELQQCGQIRAWSEQDALVLQSVAEMLSVLVQHEIDQSMIKSDAQEMKLINEIANHFRESKGQRSHDVLVQSVKLVAEHLGFKHSQIYLFSAEDNALVPQMDGQHEQLNFSQKNNPFVSVYESGSGRARKINVVPTRKAGDAWASSATTCRINAVQPTYSPTSPTRATPLS